jgi:hypothetical protein
MERGIIGKGASPFRVNLQAEPLLNAPTVISLDCAVYLK